MTAMIKFGYFSARARTTAEPTKPVPPDIRTFLAVSVILEVEDENMRSFERLWCGGNSKFGLPKLCDITTTYDIKQYRITLRTPQMILDMMLEKQLKWSEICV